MRLPIASGTRTDFRPLHRINPVRTAYVAQRCQIKGARVLDIGCGGGLLCEALQALGAEVTGIDLAPAMLETARLHAAERGVVIDYRLLQAEALAAAEPGAFDVVTCMEMVEHVPDPASIVAAIGTAIGTLLRPGGAAFLSTLNRTPKSFAQAIVAAEYIFRLIPRGTHEYERARAPLGTGAVGTQRRTCAAGRERPGVRSIHRAGELDP